MTEINYAERVAKGAALLDERRPGWALVIDLPTLDISDCDYCVLGQLMGDYADGLDTLSLTGDTSYAFGFSLTGLEFAEIAKELAKELDVSNYDRDAVYAGLREAWVEAISARLTA